MKLLLILLISSSCFAQKDTANYFLIGKIEMFQLAYKMGADPDNVTRKQVSDFLHWIVQARVIITDTTKKEKPKK